MSEDSAYRPGRGSPTLVRESTFARGRDTGRVWQRHATMASEERLRDPSGRPRSAPDAAHPGGEKGADATPIASARAKPHVPASVERHVCGPPWSPSPAPRARTRVHHSASPWAV